MQAGGKIEAGEVPLDALNEPDHWVEAEAMQLAPLTRDHVLPLARALQRQDRG